MRKAALFLAAALLSFAPGSVTGAETKVPAGKENIVLDAMSNARKAAGKKVLKGPVPFAHQAHADKNVACLDCHHKEKAGETPKPCHSCHKDTKQGDVIKLNDAFHGGDVEALPALQSCIGCHARKGKTDSPAPAKREPCDACHSLLKK